MNYKILTKEEIDILMQSGDWLDKLTDDEAFDLMQRYNELNDNPLETSVFNEFDRLNKYNIDYKISNNK